MNVVLGVCGSVAAYRACDLARELMRSGATVRACLTDNARKFVSRELFEALTGQPCLTDVFDEPDRGRMAHIDLARAADVVVVAPATANMLNKLSSGFADDMLTSLVLAFDGPLVLAPAMNPTMYAHTATQSSLNVLAARGAVIVEPAEGEVACGESGQGKLAATDAIVQAVVGVGKRSRLLSGKKVLITSGPTQEPIDDVRFVSNRSGGRMGAALAQAAVALGADVTVVTGPTAVVLPTRAKVTKVRTALQMLEAATAAVSDAHLVIGAAAVADFTVSNAVKGKLRRSDGPPELRLTPNPDVIAELARKAKPGALVVAFAAEPDEGLETVKQKLASKGVRAIVANNVSDPEIGFESDVNELVLVTQDSVERSPRFSKTQCAYWLLERLASILGQDQE